MKRRSHPVLKSGKAPYPKYGKREYLYSKAYQSWALKFRPIKASQIEGRN